MRPATDANGDDTRHELFDMNAASLGVYGQVVLRVILRQTSGADFELIHLLLRVEFSGNVIYLHSEPRLMPCRRTAWAS